MGRAAVADAVQSAYGEVGFGAFVRGQLEASYDHHQPDQQ